MEDRVLRVGEIKRGIWKWKTAQTSEVHRTIYRRNAAVNLSLGRGVLKKSMRNWNRRQI